ncbi:hypothetical protein PUNSTDRAFT_59646, partial [Punctularia strigosozonata HHB-11173 SS5]|uniref:uncharacterized protein n=1 Tax=Punctularia strigosozonata (strain HHB-11173) TaxID=741275 RepID=UPI00044173B2
KSGITGGFAPPTPNHIFTVTRPENKESLNITAAVRPKGTPGLQSAVPKSLGLSDVVGDSKAEALVEELHDILKNLPTEQPPGSEDIYGFDTSIAWGSEDLMWCNGSPQGCGGGQSEVQVTEEQKASFRRAVDIVNELVNKAQ